MCSFRSHNRGACARRASRGDHQYPGEVPGKHTSRRAWQRACSTGAAQQGGETFSCLVPSALGTPSTARAGQGCSLQHHNTVVRRRKASTACQHRGDRMQLLSVSAPRTAPREVQAEPHPQGQAACCSPQPAPA